MLIIAFQKQEEKLLFHWLFCCSHEEVNRRQDLYFPSILKMPWEQLPTHCVGCFLYMLAITDEVTFYFATIQFIHFPPFIILIFILDEIKLQCFIQLQCILKLFTLKIYGIFMQQQHDIFYILRICVLDTDRNAQSKENSVIMQVLCERSSEYQ